MALPGREVVESEAMLIGVGVELMLCDGSSPLVVCPSRCEKQCSVRVLKNRMSNPIFCFH